MLRNLIVKNLIHYFVKKLFLMTNNFERNSSRLFQFHSMINREFLKILIENFLLNYLNYFDLKLKFLN
jgi:hypothetical protein